MNLSITSAYDKSSQVTLYLGDRLELLRQIPNSSANLFVTSPPYNIGKKYEKRIALAEYLRGQEETLVEAVRTLDESGSLCWQVGNHVDGGEVFPLDTLIYQSARNWD